MSSQHARTHKRTRVAPATMLAAFLLAILAIVDVRVSSTGIAQAPRETPGSQIVVGPTVHVSAALPDVAHDEVIIAADPVDASRLIACSMINTSSGSSEDEGRSVSYLSFDAGRTWTHGTTTELITGDPSCGFAPDGSAYFMTVSAEHKWDRLGTWTLELHRSSDGGRTWEEPRFSAGGDRPWLVIDAASPIEPTPIYAMYQQRVRPLRNDGRPPPLGLFLKRSDDGGRSWETPALRLGELGRAEVSAVTPQHAAALSDGTIVLMYLTPQEFPGLAPARPPLMARGLAQYVTTSVDRGRTLTEGVKVANYLKLEGYTAAPDGSAALAADPGSTLFKDRLYAAWGDARTGRGEIWLSYSDDKGATWSRPRIVSDDHAWPPPAVGPDNAMPTLAVNNAGVVGLSWYDRRDNPDNLGFYPRFRASLDGGDTWLPSVRLTSEPNRFAASGAIVRVRPFVTKTGEGTGPLAVTFQRHWWIANGHTAGLTASADGAFHALWVDNRTGVNQVYTARITLRGTAIRNGSEDLEGLHDLTSLVTIDLSDTQLDREKHAITVHARLRNTSTKTLAGPLVLRVSSIDSELGPARAANPDRRENGALIWSFETPAGGLAPEATTSERILELEWSPVRSVTEGLDVRLNLLRLNARVLGRTE